jgi:uncharacterized membrane protein (Fun14 family)
VGFCRLRVIEVEYVSWYVGNMAGIPTIVVMILPFIGGLIVGYLFRKFLKIAIIAGIILVVLAYFGFFGLNFSALKNLADIYCPVAI